jgi:phosphohistidine phosphatase SixA
MTLYLVRHAKAGQRSAWVGDDRERPLSRTGWSQAKLLAERLAALSPSTLVSSPYARCVQTLEPLAALTGATVVTDERLGEDQPFEPVLDLLATLPDASVLCSHGDVIPDTIAALERRGLSVRCEPDWRKATVWLLEREADGTFGEATVWPPPST